MMNLIQKFLSRDRTPKTHIRKQFINYFFSIPEHNWINERCNRDHFDKLIAHLPANLLEIMMTKNPLVFIPSNELGQNSIGVVNTIVVFPEFQKLLQSNKKGAVAYLAHEVALVFLELEGGTDDQIMAEIEADKFVSDLGLTFELEDFLLMLDETIEKRLRLTYLTINHFKDY
jgi:hypothetical protein